jgi:hypothetical protein
VRKADNLPPYCAVVKKSVSLNCLDPSGPTRSVMGLLYLFFFTIVYDNARAEEGPLKFFSLHRSLGIATEAGTTGRRA